MTLRDTGCRVCLRTTSGDCGGHGPLILGSVSFGPPGSMKSEPFTLKPREDTSAKLQADLREKIAQLERECDALRAQVEALKDALQIEEDDYDVLDVYAARLVEALTNLLHYALADDLFTASVETWERHLAAEEVAALKLLADITKERGG